ncbi:Proteasome/cyclosome repeat-containing protein [Toxoplasma gondii p89]|uniref:Proteasome/cyclosome repeat-containing protein n=1 Tax=Toxoplasma gondii p89 TaxID=943119 RepID=A0A086J6Y2_TOXGO|nr:Proteasome/cyclosome repeat-containing protein [Toxoplasma gondii p89]
MLLSRLPPRGGLRLLRALFLWCINPAVLASLEEEEGEETASFCPEYSTLPCLSPEVSSPASAVPPLLRQIAKALPAASASGGSGAGLEWRAFCLLLLAESLRPTRHAPPSLPSSSSDARLHASSSVSPQDIDFAYLVSHGDAALAAARAVAQPLPDTEGEPEGEQEREEEREEGAEGEAAEKEGEGLREGTLRQRGKREARQEMYETLKKSGEQKIAEHDSNLPGTRRRSDPAGPPGETAGACKGRRGGEIGRESGRRGRFFKTGASLTEQGEKSYDCEHAKENHKNLREGQFSEMHGLERMEEDTHFFSPSVFSSSSYCRRQCVREAASMLLREVTGESRREERERAVQTQREGGEDRCIDRETESEERKKKRRIEVGMRDTVHRFACDPFLGPLVEDLLDEGDRSTPAVSPSSRHQHRYPSRSPLFSSLDVPAFQLAPFLPQIFSILHQLLQDLSLLQKTGELQRSLASLLLLLSRTLLLPAFCSFYATYYLPVEETRRLEALLRPLWRLRGSPEETHREAVGRLERETATGGWREEEMAPAQEAGVRETGEETEEVCMASVERIEEETEAKANFSELEGEQDGEDEDEDEREGGKEDEMEGAALLEEMRRETKVVSVHSAFESLFASPLDFDIFGKETQTTKRDACSSSPSSPSYSSSSSALPFSSPSPCHSALSSCPEARDCSLFTPGRRLAAALARLERERLKDSASKDAAVSTNAGGGVLGGETAGKQPPADLITSRASLASPFSGEEEPIEVKQRRRAHNYVFFLQNTKLDKGRDNTQIHRNLFHHCRSFASSTPGSATSSVSFPSSAGPSPCSSPPASLPSPFASSSPQGAHAASLGVDLRAFEGSLSGTFLSLFQDLRRARARQRRLIASSPDLDLSAEDRSREKIEETKRTLRKSLSKSSRTRKDPSRLQVPNVPHSSSASVPFSFSLSSPPSAALPSPSPAAFHPRAKRVEATRLSPSRAEERRGEREKTRAAWRLIRRLLQARMDGAALSQLAPSLQLMFSWIFDFLFSSTADLLDAREMLVAKSPRSRKAKVKKAGAGPHPGCDSSVRSLALPWEEDEEDREDSEEEFFLKAAMLVRRADLAANALLLLPGVSSSHAPFRKTQGPPPNEASTGVSSFRSVVTTRMCSPQASSVSSSVSASVQDMLELLHLEASGQSAGRSRFSVAPREVEWDSVPSTSGERGVLSRWGGVAPHLETWLGARSELRPQLSLVAAALDSSSLRLIEARLSAQGAEVLETLRESQVLALSPPLSSSGLASTAASPLRDPAASALRAFPSLARGVGAAPAGGRRAGVEVADEEARPAVPLLVQKLSPLDAALALASRDRGVALQQALAVGRGALTLGALGRWEVGGSGDRQREILPLSLLDVPPLELRVVLAPYALVATDDALQEETQETGTRRRDEERGRRRGERRLAWAASEDESLSDGAGGDNAHRLFSRGSDRDSESPSASSHVPSFSSAPVTPPTSLFASAASEPHTQARQKARTHASPACVFLPAQLISRDPQRQPPERDAWAQFHNGCSSGLTLFPAGGKPITSDILPLSSSSLSSGPFSSSFHVSSTSESRSRLSQFPASGNVVRTGGLRRVGSRHPTGATGDTETGEKTAEAERGPTRQTKRSTQAPAVSARVAGDREQLQDRGNSRNERGKRQRGARPDLAGTVASPLFPPTASRHTLKPMRDSLSCQEQLETFLRRHGEAYGPHEFGGLLLALGLAGFFRPQGASRKEDMRNLSLRLLWNAFDRETVQTGLLLGLASSAVGSRSSSLLQLCVAHLPYTLSGKFIEIEMKPAPQCAALLSLGLVFAGSQSTCISMLLLHHLLRSPCLLSDKQGLDRDAYALSAAWALGLVWLGHARGEKRREKGGRSDEGRDKRGRAARGEHRELRERRESGEWKESREQREQREQRGFGEFGVHVAGEKRCEGGETEQASFAFLFEKEEGATSFATHAHRSNLHWGCLNASEVSAPAALALGLAFLDSENEEIRRGLRIPKNPDELKDILPHVLLCKVLARALVSWSAIAPSHRWVAAQIPPPLRLLPSDSDPVRRSSLPFLRVVCPYTRRILPVHKPHRSGSRASTPRRGDTGSGNTDRGDSGRHGRRHREARMKGAAASSHARDGSRDRKHRREIKERQREAKARAEEVPLQRSARERARARTNSDRTRSSSCSSTSFPFSSAAKYRVYALAGALWALGLRFAGTNSRRCLHLLLRYLYFLRGPGFGRPSLAAAGETCVASQKLRDDCKSCGEERGTTLLEEDVEMDGEGSVYLAGSNASSHAFEALSPPLSSPHTLTFSPLLSQAQCALFRSLPARLSLPLPHAGEFAFASRDAYLDEEARDLCVLVCCLALACVAAGSCSAEVLSCLFNERRLRLARPRAETAGGATAVAAAAAAAAAEEAAGLASGDTASATAAAEAAAACARAAEENQMHPQYGACLLLHQAIGLVCMSGGRRSFAESLFTPALLLMALFPLKPPTDAADQSSHLQAARHLWVLATEWRHLAPVDVETGKRVSLPVTLLVRKETRGGRARRRVKKLQMWLPGLVPSPQRILRLEVAGDRHMPLVLRASERETREERGKETLGAKASLGEVRNPNHVERLERFKQEKRKRDRCSSGPGPLSERETGGAPPPTARCRGRVFGGQVAPSPDARGAALLAALERVLSSVVTVEGCGEEDTELSDSENCPEEILSFRNFSRCYLEASEWVSTSVDEREKQAEALRWRDCLSALPGCSEAGDSEKEVPWLLACLSQGIEETKSDWGLPHGLQGDPPGPSLLPVCKVTSADSSLLHDSLCGKLTAGPTEGEDSSGIGLGPLLRHLEKEEERRKNSVKRTRQEARHHTRLCPFAALLAACVGRQRLPFSPREVLAAQCLRSFHDCFRFYFFPFLTPALLPPLFASQMESLRLAFSPFSSPYALFPLSRTRGRDLTYGGSPVDSGLRLGNDDTTSNRVRQLVSLFLREIAIVYYASAATAFLRLSIDRRRGDRGAQRAGTPFVEPEARERDEALAKLNASEARQSREGEASACGSRANLVGLEASPRPRNVRATRERRGDGGREILCAANALSSFLVFHRLPLLDDWLLFIRSVERKAAGHPSRLVFSPTGTRSREAAREETRGEVGAGAAWAFGEVEAATEAKRGETMQRQQSLQRALQLAYLAAPRATVEGKNLLAEALMETVFVEEQ